MKEGRMERREMVKAIKKSSSAGVVAGFPHLRSAEKRRRSAEEEEDIEGDTQLSFPPPPPPPFLRKRTIVNKILPEGSKTLFTRDIACPDGRKIKQADFETFFRKVGKVVNVSIQFYTNEQYVKLAEIEFESHDVAKNALKNYNMRRLFGFVVKLDVSPEDIGGTQLSRYAPILLLFGGRRKKYSSYDEVVAGSSAEEKGVTQLIPDNKDMEMVADHAPYVFDEFIWVDKILPKDSKTLFATNIICPAGRKIVQADFEKFFQGVGKVVNVCITLSPNQICVELAEIEFESHDVAKKALNKFDRRLLFGSCVKLDVCPEGSGKSYKMLDSTYRHHIICICLGKVKSMMLECELYELFSSCGGIIWVNAKENRKEKASCFSIWHAYIKFMDGENLSKALKLDGTEFRGAPLQVRRAKVFCSSIFC